VTTPHKIETSFRLLTYSDFCLDLAETPDSRSPSSVLFLLNMSLVLRPTVSRPVCLGIKHPSGAYDQTFVSVRRLQVC
jgi:hypothetical protein